MSDQLKKNPLVYIVILNWNNSADTIDCLQSISVCDYQSFVPIVVDNGSTNGSDERIRERFPAIKMIKLDSNLGYAKGNNVGIQYAMDSGAEYILVLNNDTLIEPTMLRKLIQFAESNPNAGMVGPKMFCIEPENTIFATGGFIDWSKGEAYNRGMFRPASDFDNLQQPEHVDFIAGCCLLVSRRFIEDVGDLDSVYFLNFEDVDWGTRAWRQGYEVWFAPQAIMWHKVSATLGKTSPLNTYYMTRNALLFFWRNSPPQHRYLAISRIILRTLRRITAWTLKPQYWTETFRNLRLANIMALRDFTMGHFGQIKVDET